MSETAKTYLTTNEILAKCDRGDYETQEHALSEFINRLFEETALKGTLNFGELEMIENPRARVQWLKNLYAVTVEAHEREAEWCW